MPETFIHDYVLLPRARQQYASLDQGEQEEIDRLIDRVRADPSVDGVVRFDLPAPPAILRLFDNGTWAFVYSVMPPFVVQIWAIARSTPGQPPRLTA